MTDKSIGNASNEEFLEQVDKSLGDVRDGGDNETDLNKTVMENVAKISKKERKKQRKLNKSHEEKGNISLTKTDISEPSQQLQIDQQNSTEITAVSSQWCSSEGGDLRGLIGLMSTVKANDNKEEGHVLQTSVKTNHLNPRSMVDQKNNSVNLPSCSWNQKPTKKTAESKSNDTNLKEKRKLSDTPIPQSKRQKHEPAVDNSKVDDSLKVAIIDANNLDGILEAKVWENAKASIYGGIRKYIRTNPDADDLPVYEFLGNQKGVRIVSCGDEMSLNFLKSLVESLNFEEDGVSLKVILRSEIPVIKRFKISVPITSEDETFEDLKAMIRGQNKKIGSSKWKFYIPKDKEEKAVGGTRYLMFIGMHEEQVQKIKELNFFIHYGLEKLQLLEIDISNAADKPEQPPTTQNQMEIDDDADAKQS